MKKTISVIFFTYTIIIAFAQGRKELVQLTDMLKIKTAGNITVSNDGSKAAFTVTSIEPDERTKQDYKYVTQIYSFDIKGSSTPLQLTYSKESSASPAWSPDGKNLAFVRSTDGKPQIFILSLNGGEAWQLTKSGYGAANPNGHPMAAELFFLPLSP